MSKCKRFVCDRSQSASIHAGRKAAKNELGGRAGEGGEMTRIQILVLWFVSLGVVWLTADMRRIYEERLRGVEVHANIVPELVNCAQREGFEMKSDTWYAISTTNICEIRQVQRF